MTRLTKNIIYNVTGQGLVLLLSLIAVRFIFRRLGDDVFGIILFNLVLTTVLVSTLEVGISATIVREVSSHFDGDRDYVAALIGTASTVYWGMGVILVVVIWLTAPLLVTQWVNLTSLDRDTAATILRILSATALVALPKTLYASVFRGRQRMALNNLIDVATSATQQAGILIFLLAGAGVLVVAGWIATSVILGIVAYILVAARLVGWPMLKPIFSASVVRRTLGFTGHMTVISITSLIHTQVAQVIVSKIMPIAEFGFFSFASSMVYRLTFVTNAVAQAAFPSFASLFAAGDRPSLLLQYRKLHDLVCYGAVPLFTGLCFAAVPVYTFVFRADVANRLLLPTAFLALGIWMNATVTIPYILSIAMGKPVIVARQNVYALLIVLPATTLLILRFGIVGASLSLVVYHLFAYAYMVPRICRECLQVPPAGWYVHLLRVVGLGVLTYTPAWLAYSYTNPSSLPVAVITYAAGTVAFAFGAYRLIAPDLRTTIHRLPRSLIARRTPSEPVC